MSDEAAIREVVERYFYSLDARDPEALLSCFTQDATARYHVGNIGERATVGARAIADEIMANQRRYPASNHTASSVYMVDRGDHVAVCTFAVAHVYNGAIIVVRGLRYDDDFVREDGAWRIRARSHAPQWQYEAAGVPPQMKPPER